MGYYDFQSRKTNFTTEPDPKNTILFLTLLKNIRMKPTKLRLTLFFILLYVSSTAQFRKYSNEFLNIGAGARGLAMGGAQVASVEDGTAGYWNPAGLVGM